MRFIYIVFKIHEVYISYNFYIINENRLQILIKDKNLKV